MRIVSKEEAKKSIEDDSEDGFIPKLLQESVFASVASR